MIKVDLNVGTTINLPSIPSTGYQWTMAPSDNVQVQEDFISNAESDEEVGSGGTSVFRLSFNLPGKYEISFNYSRPWLNEVLDSKVYHFDVS